MILAVGVAQLGRLGEIPEILEGKEHPKYLISVSSGL